MHPSLSATGTSDDSAWCAIAVVDINWRKNMTTFNTRSAANTNAQAEREPADHYVNIYFQSKQIGYITLDKFPDLVEVLQANEANATKLLSQCEGVYRQRGMATPVKFDLSGF